MYMVIFTKTNIESMVYISVMKSYLGILIFKESTEKLTFSISNIYYFRDLTFWGWSSPFQNDPLLLGNHTLFTHNFWSTPFLQLLGDAIPPFYKGGGGAGRAHYVYIYIWICITTLTLYSHFGSDLRDHNENKLFLPVLCYPSHCWCYSHLSAVIFQLQLLYFNF